MAKFKVGDKVRLKENISPNQSYNGVSLSPTIIQHIRKTSYVTINCCDNNTVLIRNSVEPEIKWWVGEDALELYEPHTYQIGDIVRIKKREGSNGDYPFSFADNMKELAGALCRISKIIPNQSKDYQECKYFNGDYSGYRLEPLDPSDKRDFGYKWHSSMFELITSPPKIQLQATSLRVRDLVSICGIVGRIQLSPGNYYLDFDNISDQEHISCCKKLRELVPNFDKIANKLAVYNPDNRFFPEFKTIDELMRFVQAINAEYNSKQPTILKKSETYEIRFQKPKTSSIRGSVPTGRAICGRRCKTAIKLGHLSNTTCHC